MVLLLARLDRVRADGASGGDGLLPGHAALHEDAGGHEARAAEAALAVNEPASPPSSAVWMAWRFSLQAASHPAVGTEKSSIGG